MAGQLSDRHPPRRAGTPGTSGVSGFTLIELLVVIAVLSVLSVGSALLVTRRGGGPPGDAGAFQEAHERMRSLAVHGQELRGIHVSARGRRLALRRDGAWQPAGPELRWRGRVRIDVAGGPARSGTPQILFFPDGRSTAFDGWFSEAGGDPVHCRSDGWTGLRCEVP